MNERELFLAALEIEDPAARQAHLATKCGDNANMLARVESLLASHEGQTEFLKTPAVEQIKGDGPIGGVDATMLVGDGSTCDDEFYAATPETNPAALGGRSPDDEADEIPLGYLQPSSAPDSLGRLGHYDVLEVVGRGAFGTVLRAFDAKLQRVVAIKVLAPEMAATSPARKRFLREARSSAAVRHENVVAIYAVEDEPISYLVMEYIPGRTLQQRLEEQGPLDVAGVLQIGKQIADGLAAAHAEDLIHRDVKPGNILLEGGVNDRVKITDFGLARTADDASMTQSGMIAGTPLYMAPEQALGQKLDQRADLFSFGSVLYQMISGRPPFRAPTTVAVLKRVSEDEPRPIQEIIPETPNWICRLISRLHAKNPDDRYRSAKEVSDLLAQCSIDLQAGRIPQIHDSSSAADENKLAVTSKLSQPRRSRSLMWGPIAKVAIALILLGVGCFTVYQLMTGSDSPTEFGAQSDRDVEPPKPPSAPRIPVEPVQWPADAPVLAIAPFNTDEAKQHQRAWAEYLGLQAEKQILLGQTKDGKDVTLDMALIPPGEFLLGSSDEQIAQFREQYRDNGLTQRDFKWLDREGPQRAVRITRPFYMSRTEFTNDQFRRFVDADNFKTEAESSGKGSWAMQNGRMVRDPSRNWQTQRSTGPDAPVIHVTWNDANACCAWLSRQEADLTFALPTEAQWEYACRAGSTTAWCFGNETELLKDYAIANINWFRLVGTKKQNAFSLNDMHGNVWEWCHDSYYSYRDAASTDPVGPLDGANKITRGGNCFGGFDKSSWNNGSDCRSAVRYEKPADHSVMDTGFRVVATIPEKLIQSKVAASQEKGAFALSFDGRDDYVATPAKLDIRRPFTVEAVVTLASSPGEHTFVVADLDLAGIGFGPTPTGKWQTSLNEGVNGRASIKGYRGVESGDDIRMNQQTHVVATFDGEVLTLFVDGKKQPNSRSFEQVFVSPLSLMIGANPDEGVGDRDFFQGLIEEVRISGTVRYTEDFTPTLRFETDDQTIALYHFDEGSGNILNDASGNERHGTIVGAKWVHPNDKPSRENASQ